MWDVAFKIMAAKVNSLEECYNNYILIDVGANINNKKYAKDADSVIQRAVDSGVLKIIVPGTSIKSSREALRLAKFYPQVIYATAGIHPFEAKTWDEESASSLREMIQNNSECVAVGLCGLDYTKDFSPQEIQRHVFEMQVALACELKKPLMMYSKSAHKDTLDILMKYIAMLPALVLYSFVGSAEEAFDYLNMDDCYIGVTGYFCKDNAENGMQKLIESGTLPLNRILVQTDSPFFYPNSRSSKLSDSVKNSLTTRSLTFVERYCTFQRNEPCSLPVIVELIAGLLKKNPEEVAVATAFNSLKIFGLSEVFQNCTSAITKTLWSKVITGTKEVKF